MIHCIECKMTNDYPCEKWGICPNEDDFLDKVITKQNTISHEQR